MRTEFAKLQAQVEALNNEMRETVVSQNAVNPQKYVAMSRAMETNSRVFRNSALSTGKFAAEQLRLNSATDEYIKRLNKQKLSFRDLRKEWAIGRAAFREQLAMQSMVVKKMPGTKNGRQIVDVVVPNEVHQDLKTLGNEIGFIREQTRSAATQMVNWGKNTQWAGRQLMVGFTVPVAAFGAAAGVMAYQVDSQLTRIQKVYDTTAQVVTGDSRSMAAVETELAQVREASMRTAITSAKEYGAAATDTLKVQADLAATGLKGTQLQQYTNETIRLATLGEMDYQQATQTTVALQTAFKLSTEDLTKAFNFMNATENATSLSIQDIAEATPRAASAMSALGVTVEQMTVLLTSMKESGVDAAEAANALKSATGTMLAPSPAAQKFIDQVSDGRIQIAKIAEEADGNLYVALQHLAQQMEGLSKFEKQQILVKLFGKYQFNRVSAMLYNLEAAVNGTQNQTHKAMELMGKDSATLADTAERELKRFQDSTAGRFKTTLETLKAELSLMGEPFLKIATDVMSVITKLIEKFNSLPEGVKNVASWFAIGGALIGPIIMLTGLFANLIGNMLKGAVAVTGFLGKMELLDTESKAARLATDLATQGFVTEASAVQKLTAEIKLLALANQEATLATRQMMLASQGYSSTEIALMTAKPTPPKGAPGAVLHPGTVAAKEAAAAKSVEESTKKSASASKAMGGSMLLTAAAMGTMAVNSNETIDNMAEIVMYAALLGPALTAIPWKAMGTGIASMTTRFKGGFLPAVGGGVKGIGTMLLNFAKFAGPAGLIVGAIGGMVYLNSKIDDTAEAMEKLTKTGETWADIMGFTARQPGTLVDPKTGETVKTLTTMVNELNEKAPEVGKAIKDAMDDAGDGMSKAAAEAEAMNLAIRQGLEVMSSGGTAKQAREAVKASLMAGIQDINKVNDLMAKINLKVKFNVDEQVIREQIRQTMDLTQKYINDEVDRNWAEWTVDLISGDLSGKTEGSEQAIKDAANTFYDQWETANDATKIKMIRAIQLRNEALRDAAIKPYLSDPEAAKVLEKYNIKTGGQFYTRAENLGFTAKDVDILNKAGVAYTDMLVKIFNIDDASNQFTKSLAEQAGLQDASIGNMEELLAHIVPGYLTLDQAQKSYNRQIQGGVDNLFRVSDAQKLQILNQLRVARGQEKTGRLLDMFGPATVKWVDKTKDAAGAVDVVNRNLERTKSLMGSITKEDITNLGKDAMSSFQQGIADATTDSFQSSMDNAMAAAQAAGDARIEAQARQHENAMNAFDKRWENRQKAVENSYDKRIKKIQDSMDAEQAADDLRQKLFDREMTRLDRLNEAANRDIDFNVALNSGDFDKAAKIRNDAEAQAADWVLQDAADAGGKKSDKRQDKMQKHMDALEKQKDRRLDALKEVEDAERKALQRSQDRQEKALKAQVDATIEAERKKWEVQKKNLDEALAHFMGYTATSDKDLRKHIEQWEDRYKGFNLVTKGEFNTTTKNIAEYLKRNLMDAQAEFANQKQWALSGYRIASAMLDGAFGMTTKQFKKWLITGVYPDKSNPPSPDDINGKYKGGSTQHKGGVQDSFYHTGGRIGIDNGGRNGYAHTAPLSRNEVPMVAERGEWMVNKEMSSKYHDVLNQINNDTFDPARPYKSAPKATGGGGMGFAGLMGALMAKAIMSTVTTGIRTGAMNAFTKQSESGSFKAGKAGNYGDISFTNEQLRNASVIASVGKNMGMSARDIQIGIMTAITESMLRNVNYGDRDSLGLFQQRPSMGWGTAAQVTDPNYAAKKFFSVLKGVSGRAEMTPWLAAQSVQRSAYADGSNYRQYWDEAQAIFRGLKSNNSVGGAGGTSTYAPGKGGWRKPAPPGLGWANSHDYRAPLGTPLYAVSDGTIVESRAITSGGSPGNGKYSTPYRSYGETIAMRTASGDIFRYAHLTPGTRIGTGPVKGGTMIGRSGQTGNATGPHVHFDVNGDYDARGWLQRHAVSLQKGAKNIRWDNTIANLHKGEAVLTEDINRKFQQGVDNFANGVNTTYNVNVNVSETNANADEITRKVMTAIKRAENRKPQSRKQ